MRFWGAILALAVVLLPESALAQTRRAFVAAVGDYRSLTDLQKTLGDANGYAQAFGDNLKFQVTQAPANATRAQFNAAFGQFLASIRPGDEVAFIFSGHGWSDGVENYLALSDAPRDASEYELKTETLALTTNILAQINARKPRLTLAIIDACRDNPFDNGTKAGFEKGLVRTEVAAGTMVVYAAGQRQKALDRLSSSDNAQYSLFTRVLLPKLRDPALPLMASVDEARDEVARLAATIDHQQRPAVYSDVSLAFCFAGTCRGATPPDTDTALWVEITSTDATCTDYERYRRQFPNGKYAGQAGRILSRAPCAAPAGAGNATTAGLAASPAGNVTSETLSASDTISAAKPDAKFTQTNPTRLAGETFSDCSDCPEMVSIPAGSFMMGSPTSEVGRQRDEGPQRRVTVPTFAAGKYEVTWNDYNACISAGGCTSLKADGFGGGTRPVTNVPWDAAVAYTKWLSIKTGRTYRLLSEAEWEYAARAGSSGRWNFGDNEGSLGLYAWFSSSDPGGTRPVGTKMANAFGLHDLHGNVSEWVEDCYEGVVPDATGSVISSLFGLGSCSYRLSRGGSWNDSPTFLRSAFRLKSKPTDRSYMQGFRLARTL
jgi:formylglycine-generating enzyme required for sulfatase activity